MAYDETVGSVVRIKLGAERSHELHELVVSLVEPFIRIFLWWLGVLCAVVRAFQEFNVVPQMGQQER